MNNDTTFDYIIIGAGTAGLAALREVRKRTERYLIVNEGPWGTTCARVGCMPSKALIEAANAFHGRHTFEEFGLRGASALTADLPAVLQRVRDLRDDFVAGALKATSELGSAQMSGRATLLGPHSVDIDGTTHILVGEGNGPINAAVHALQNAGIAAARIDYAGEQAACARPRPDFRLQLAIRCGGRIAPHRTCGHAGVRTKRELAIDQVVHDPDGIAAVRGMADQGRADESGPSGDQDSRRPLAHAPPPRRGLSG